MKISSWLKFAATAGLALYAVPGAFPAAFCIMVFCIFIAMLLFYVRYGGLEVEAQVEDDTDS